MSILMVPTRSFFSFSLYSTKDSTLPFRNFQFSPNFLNYPVYLSSFRGNFDGFRLGFSQICTNHAAEILNRSEMIISEASDDDELWAASRLRVECFNEFRQAYGIDDHKKYLAEREFEALKERVAGKRTGFKRVSCINATIPLSQLRNCPSFLISMCKISRDGEDQVVIGTLDLNQCPRLPDEISGKRPEAIGADFARAYLSNVCVSEDLQRNGVGYALVAKSKEVAQNWGITDLYVHVAVDNEPARQLYAKCGFMYENDEPAWQARFLGRPRRFLLWSDLTPNDCSHL